MVIAGYGMSSLAESSGIFSDDMAVCQLMPDNKTSLTAPCNAMKALPNTCSSYMGQQWLDGRRRTGSQAVSEVRIIAGK